jgi:branched-chain amino acid transport system substrate-binding protein
MRPLRKPFTVAAVLGAAALAVAGCGSSSSGSSSSGGGSGAAASGTTSASNASSGSGSGSGASLGTPHKATGSPYVFGLINDETGPVTFPEARQAEIAAAQYANNYLNGINGHPIQLVDCISDATAPTSARCANELISKHPLAILGAADTGTPGSEPVYLRAGLAYLGGVPFTPVEQNAPNSVQFWSLSLGDNAAASVYAVKTLGAKNVSVLYFNNSQGKIAGLGIIPPTLKAAGATSVKTVGIPPTSPDPSPEVAQAVSSHPDAVYVDIPNNCGVVLKDLKSLGYTGKVIGIDPCTSPQAISSAAGGAEGMYIATPANSAGSEFGVFVSALKKYAAPNTAIDGISEVSFATVLNVRGALSTLKGTPTTKSILAAFKSGSNHPNYMSHPYTCNGQAVAKAVSICNDYYLMEQIKNGQPVISNPTDWVTSKGYFKGLTLGG